MGVFLQPDPIGFKGDAANIYRFCGNDPVDRTDPMGLEHASARILPDRQWEMACLMDSGNSFQGSLEEYMKRLQPAGNIQFGLVDATNNGEKSKSIDSKLKHFDIPGAIDRLRDKVAEYSRRFSKYPDGQEVVDNLQSALEEGRIRPGKSSDFIKSNPMSTRGNIIYVDSMAKISPREIPSLLAHEGEHLADNLHENDKGYLRERRAYNVQFGFGQVTGSTRPLKTNKEILSDL